MNELARLGVSMDTKALKDGKAALDALVPSAQRAEKATEKFNKAAAGITASGGIKSFATAAVGATGASDRLTKAALGTGTAMRTVQAAAAGAASPVNNLVGGLTRVSLATGQADAHIQAYRNSLASVPAAANGAATSLDRLGAAANDNINRLQSTPGNIAAQFQDIGITAAGGMSPLLIALQQGTQLSSALAGGMGNVIAAFRQLFSVTTILTVGMVALVAAGLQAVDWMQVGEVVVNLLADGMEKGAVAAVYLGTVLAIAFAPQILNSVRVMTVSVGTGLVGALNAATVASLRFAAANPFGLMVLAIGLVIGAMILLNDKFGGVFTDILRVVKNVANAIIRFFSIAFNTVLQRAQSAANGMVTIFNAVSKGLGFDVKLGKVDFSGAQIDTREGRDFVGDIAGFVSSAASTGAGLLRNAFTPDDIAAAGGASGAATAGGAGGGSNATSEIDRQAEAYQRLIERANARVLSLTDEANALGMTDEAARLYLARQDLLAQAVDQGIKLDERRRAGIELVAQAISDAQSAVEIAEQNKATREFLDDFTRGLELQTAELARSRGELGLTGAALQAYRIESDLLNRAARENIELTPEYVASVRQQAQTYSELNEQINEQRQRMEDSRSTIRSFFGDLLSNLQQGQNAWQAFGNAVLNVVNRIIDRLLDFAADQAFNSLLGAFGGGKSGGNVKGASAGKSLGSLFKFANGGAFTNGIYNDPTVFKFAKGGAFGVMGEAGPEAVMPLKRGPDGSLGVKVQAMEPQMVVVRVVTDDARFDAYVDDRIGQSAPQVAEAGSVIRQREDALLQSRRLA